MEVANPSYTTAILVAAVVYCTLFVVLSILFGMIAGLLNVHYKHASTIAAIAAIGPALIAFAWVIG